MLLTRYPNQTNENSELESGDETEPDPTDDNELDPLIEPTQNQESISVH